MIYKLLSRLGIEVWKDVPEYKGHYQVSNLGNVKNIKKNKFKYVGFINYAKNVLRQKPRKYVTLSKYGKQKNYTIAILMAKAFLNYKNNDKKLIIDHIDNKPLNDKLYNLQILSHRINVSKDKKNKTSKFIGVNKKGTRWIAQIGINNKLKYIGCYKTEMEAAEAYQKELQKL